MSDAAIFTLVFGGLFVLRIIAATIVFVLILPRGDRCPMCDASTLRVHAPALRRFHLPLAKRWCLVCGWEGMMRIQPPDVSSGDKAARSPAVPTIEQPSRKS
jgi:hypothetical protein